MQFPVFFGTNSGCNLLSVHLLQIV